MASDTTDAEMIEPISYKTVTVKTYKVGYVNTSEGSQAGSSEILSHVMDLGRTAYFKSSLFNECS